MESNKTVTDGLAIRAINYRVILVQVMICVFLFINFFLMMTFFLKDCFYTSMRYILFVVTLFSDCLFLLMTNALLIFSYFNFAIQIWLCVIIYIVLAEYSFVTPLTLTAMALERYVAICMPLRHAELCTTRTTLHLIIIIHSISFVPGFVIVAIFFARVTHVVYNMGTVCSVESFILYEWMNHLRSVLYLLYFLIMCIIIVFSYVQIMKVAKAASGENKKSTWRGLRTVILHAFQLLLCLIQMWCPFIEAAMLQIDFMLFINIRYFNYITFILAPRCLSPLIYGLRDELFFQAVRYYALCGLYKKQASV
ncbi:odorant receptor 131-2-like [Nothobranchius furzeri]|uniref:Mu-type opioid receptor-like n=1 Tax=Nothobranchius furzeri TaxID=105023 RepID=A0A9D2XBC7_NOTFU|nr:odorant receptor 131-2-like [Nothobranchius furzeri]KAF7199167.1 mu-type opioid receptor-like [Nothobranchius furzeri]